MATYFPQLQQPNMAPQNALTQNFLGMQQAGQENAMRRQQMVSRDQQLEHARKQDKMDMKIKVFKAGLDSGNPQYFQSLWQQTFPGEDAPEMQLSGGNIKIAMKSPDGQPITLEGAQENVGKYLTWLEANQDKHPLEQVKAAAGYGVSTGIGNQGKGAVTPYSFVPTSKGVMRGNRATGDAEYVKIDDNVPLPVSADVDLAGRKKNIEQRETIKGKAQGQEEVGLPQNIAGTQETVGLVDELLKHPGFGMAVGKSSMLMTQKLPGTDAYGFQKRLDQLKGKQFMEAYKTLKGGGQITEIEGQKATDAMSRMDIGLKEEEFAQAAREFQEIIQRGIKRQKIIAQKGAGVYVVRTGTLKDGRKVAEYSDGSVELDD